MTSTRRIVAGIEQLNPPGCVVRGTRHWKIIGPDGRLAGIVPFKLRTEGISANLASQLRRAGVRLPGRRP